MSRVEYLGPCCWPRALPELRTLLDQHGSPSAARLAALMGVTERTARRWIAQGQAPRSVLLVLYLASSAALDERAARADQAARLHAGLYEAARRELRALAQLVERLAPLARCGAANDAIAARVSS